MSKVANSQLHSWSRQVPWAVFSLAPLVLLVAAYLVALLILGSGWQIFLPEARSPFIPVHGIAVFYFAAGRLLYYTAPIAIGWATAWLAARWRTRAVWPVIGFAILALVSVAVRVEADAGPLLRKNVGMGFDVSSLLHAEGLLITAVVFGAMAVPYLLLRRRIAHTA